MTRGQEVCHCLVCEPDAASSPAPPGPLLTAGSSGWPQRVALLVASGGTARGAHEGSGRDRHPHGSHSPMSRPPCSPSLPAWLLLPGGVPATWPLQLGLSSGPSLWSLAAFLCHCFLPSFPEPVLLEKVGLRDDALLFLLSYFPPFSVLL